MMLNDSAIKQDDEMKANQDIAANANWLGFSLSPHMKLESSGNQSPPPLSIPSAFVHPEAQVNYGIYFGASDSHSPNGGCFFSPLPVMPLKSDGSLCIMEALSSSQTQVTTCSPPKLEDFFGGESIGVHQFDSNRYFQHESNSHSYQNQQYSYYPYFRSHEMLPEMHKDIHFSDFNLHLPNERVKAVGCMANQGESGSDMSALGFGNLQPLSLSMSPGSQSSCVVATQLVSPDVMNCSALETNKKRSADKVDQKQIVYRKSLDTFGQRTSQYRGVTRHRWTGRYEAHLWDNSCKKEGQSRKGRQVYLGGYDMEDKAARAYDLAALKYWGPSTHINFPLENYQKEVEDMKSMSRQEFVAHLRRKSSGFSRGASIYRGVTRHHQHGRWQARIGRVAGNKDLYLGTFSTQEDAAEAYDIAAIKFRGVNAVTNFDITRYDVDRIMASSTLPTGDVARRSKDIVHVNDQTHSNVVPCQKLGLYSSLNEVEGQTDEVGVVDYMHTMIEDSGTLPVHMSNPSSLVTSVNDSRKGSPLSMRGAIFNDNATSWMIPPSQPPVSLPPMQVFAAWADS